MNLYELTGQFKELMDLAEYEDLDQQIIADTLEGIEFEFEEKADAYAKVMKALEGNVAALDSEIDRLERKKKTIKNNIANMKYALEQAMVETGKTKFKTNLFSFGMQKNPASVVIDDENGIPGDFLIYQLPKIDKTAIKDYLKTLDENDTCTWAHLNQTESLRIR